MKKNVLFIALVIFAIQINAQFNNSRATSVPVSNQIGLEPGTQKIIFKFKEISMIWEYYSKE